MLGKGLLTEPSPASSGNTGMLREALLSYESAHPRRIDCEAIGVDGGLCFCFENPLLAGLARNEKVDYNPDRLALAGVGRTIHCALLAQIQLRRAGMRATENGTAKGMAVDNVGLVASGGLLALPGPG